MPVGPSSEEEAAFVAQERENGFLAVAPAPSRLSEPAEPAGGLPALDDLVKRIPMPTRDLLEELFRAKFIAVKRVPPGALK